MTCIECSEQPGQLFQSAEGKRKQVLGTKSRRLKSGYVTWKRNKLACGHKQKIVKLIIYQITQLRNGM